MVAWCRALLVLVFCMLVASASSARELVVAPRVANGSATVDALHSEAADDAATTDGGHVARELHEWAQVHQDASPLHNQTHCSDCVVVIGIKSRVLHGFRERQAIRATWAGPLITRKYGARVVFVGCEPDWSELPPREANATRHALDIEKRYFGDLLTHELDGCVDSYFQLVEKTLSFLLWTRVQYPSAPYVMMTDDDVYVRIDQLAALLENALTPRRRFFGGQVWSTQFQSTIYTIRTPTEKNHVSHSHYPMSSLPPFAIGPHYVLSADIVRFLARNQRSLRGVGTLEDVSVSFWLLSLLRLSPTHLDAFDNIRFSLCHNALVSYANLSPPGMKIAHMNVLARRGFCRGFSVASWAKDPQGGYLPPLQLVGGRREEQPFEVEWDLRYDWSSRLSQIAARLLATKSDESALAVWIPSHVAFVGFCKQLMEVAVSTMPTTALDSTFCAQLRGHLTGLLHETMVQKPHVASFFGLAKTNLHQGLNEPVVMITLSSRAMAFRMLVESLVAGMYADAQVYILGTAEYAARFQHIAPDIEVTVNDEEAFSEAAKRTRRITICVDTAQGVCNPHGDRTAWILDRPMSQLPSPQSITLPLASLGFINRTTHTPLDLLRRVGARRGSEQFNFAVFKCRRRGPVASAAARVLLNIFEELDAAAFRVHCVETSSTSEVPDLDHAVMKYSAFKFALVVEDRLNTVGRIGNELVTAFLAGCVPIYLGDSPTVARIFNTEAFINCHNFRSLRACAQHVLAVHVDPSRYEKLRIQPPVNDERSFFEAFSWHPVVRESLGHKIGPESVAYRLKMILESL